MNETGIMIVMFGPPNSGKGTYGTRLSKRFGVPFISAGDLVRGQLSKDESWFGGRYSWDAYNEGILVPGDLMGNLIRETISNTGGACVLDGYPRTTEQLGFFDDFGFPYALVNIVQDDDVLVRRALGRMTCSECGEIFAEGNPNMMTNDDGSCTRCGGVVERTTDDTEEGVRKRLDRYREETLPILTSMRRRALMWIEVSPMTDDVDEVSGKIGDQIIEADIPSLIIEKSNI